MQDWKVWKKAELKVVLKAEGRAEGRAEEKNNIARKMLANGLSIEQIALITGLTEKEIKEL